MFKQKLIIFIRKSKANSNNSKIRMNDIPRNKESAPPRALRKAEPNTFRGKIRNLLGDQSNTNRFIGFDFINEFGFFAFKINV